MGGWQLWLTSAVIAALVTGLMNLPKIRGEGRKSSAEAEGERFDTYRETTDATIANLQADCARCNDKLVTMDARVERLDGDLRAAKRVLRMVVRAYDANDPAAHDEAVAAARELA